VNRSARVRVLNERIAQKAAEHRFVSRVPLLCECDEPECRETFLIGLDDYHQVAASGGVLTVPGHRVDGAATGFQNGDYWVQHRQGKGNGDTRSFG